MPRTHAHTHTQHAQDCTPLHYSARDGFKDAVEALLTKKAEVNAKNVRLFNWGWVWWGVCVREEDVTTRNEDRSSALYVRPRYVND